MKTKITLFVTACVLTATAGIKAEPPPAPVPPLTKELQDWNQSGNIKALDEKGPDGGCIVHMEGAADLCADLSGLDPTAPKTYKISFFYRRLSPGTDWIGCVQVFFQKPNWETISPISFQKDYPASSKEWTKVSEIFKGPAEAVTARLQAHCDANAIVEVADLKLQVAPDAN